MMITEVLLGPPGANEFGQGPGRVYIGGVGSGYNSYQSRRLSCHGLSLSIMLGTPRTKLSQLSSQYPSRHEVQHLLRQATGLGF